MKTKQQQYAALVEQRKACRRCVGLANPAEPELRHFDSGEIGPWSLPHQCRALPEERWPSGKDRTRVGVELRFIVPAAAN